MIERLEDELGHTRKVEARSAGTQGDAPADPNGEDVENEAKDEKRKSRDLRFVVENIVSCLENWYDEFNRERTLNNLKDWLKTRKA